jgi:spore coat polysaccharide biosynthesis protein SpsF
MLNVGIIIQARMGSTRLPGKILMTVNEMSFLKHQLIRLSKINVPIYIATTTENLDNELVEFSIQNNLDFFRGDENNVLSRYYGCALINKLDVIIRITSDCPLIDADLISASLAEYLFMNDSLIYFSNAIERTYPRGFDFEIFSFELLKNAYENAVEVSDLEHVTPYIWKNKNGNVKIVHKLNNINNSKYRLTLDTIEDFKLLKILIEKHNGSNLTGDEIIEILNNNPEYYLINAHIEQKKL